MTPLLARLSVYNMAAGAALIWAHSQGLVVPVFASDTSYLSFAIAFLFGAGLGLTLFSALDGGDTILNAQLADVSNWLVTLGLLGTVVGFSIALSGIDVAALTTAEGVQRSAAQLMTGMQVAIGTTIVGGFCALWLDIGRRILETAVSRRNRK